MAAQGEGGSWMSEIGRRSGGPWRTSYQSITALLRFGLSLAATGGPTS